MIKLLDFPFICRYSDKGDLLFQLCLECSVFLLIGAMRNYFKLNHCSEVLSNLFFCILGSLFVGISLSVFTIPNAIAPGGVSGLSTALAYICGMRVSVMSLLLNIPILVLAWRHLTRQTVIYSLICILLLSFSIELSSRFLPTYTGNILIAAVYGGVLCGLGTGILFLKGITTGGTDLVALLLHTYFRNTPNGILLMIIDSIVVIIAVFVFQDIEVALTSTITIYVTSKIIDMLSQGVDYAKVICIVTDKGTEMSELLNIETDRGNTRIRASGGFSGKEKTLLFTVIKRNALAKTLDLIREMDPSAFVFVMNSTEVHGEGFLLD